MALRLLEEMPQIHKFKVGDVWDAPWIHERHDGCPEWDNCDGKHLYIVLPNMDFHDINSRASNCTKPEDRKHRCWVVHGDVEHMTVDKKGETCDAGGGSIIRYGDKGWHGFIRNGEFVTV